jgi:hypothetical protein
MAEEKKMMLEIEGEHLPAFLACLAIGTLEAIRQGALPAEAGIWSLAARRLWEPIVGRSPLVDQIIDVLKECDELSAVEELIPSELGSQIERLIARLKGLVDGQPAWHASWRQGQMT